MTKFLYADFLENKRTYNLAQGAWKRLFSSLLQEYGYTYTPYINQTQNGKKEYDGNPIFSAFIPEINRAIRIIQVAPDDDGDEISKNLVSDEEILDNISVKDLMNLVS